ncbi:MAG TPA: DUF2076 domain-containing protein [Stellaceae bacterium]
MTPQERDLVTALLSRLAQHGTQPKDADADALIRRAMAQQPDAPYYLVQTVLVQDMALRNAESRIAELERQLAQAKAAPAPQDQPQSSFLAGASRGSVPSAGTGTRSPPGAAPAPVWSQSGGAGAAAYGAAPPSAVPASAPSLMPGAGSGFLRQAATTAAGIAGGALLFQGIQSLFGPHYGGGFLSGMPTQPGISETVNNYYYEDQGQNAPDTREADADTGADQDQSYAADQDMADADFADQDFGSDDSNYDV